MSSFNITAKGEPTPDMLNGYGTKYFEEASLSVQHHSSSLTLAVLDNAFQAGKTVKFYRFGAADSARESRCTAINYLLRKVGSLEPMALRDFLMNAEYPPTEGYSSVSLPDYPDLEATLYISERKAVKTFSPFHLGALKKLPEIPGKWTLAHVKRALANGQFTDLKCVQKLTDDYAYDAAANFQAGPRDAMPLLRELTEDPSGWWTQLTGNRVSLCCHHFDSNSFILNV